MERALDGVAFTYDNALAGIALLACGEPGSARRIADALVLASTRDAYYRDGRVRNAYKAGPMPEAKPALPGYWSAERNQWIADAYQLSSATGNVAWAALLLLNLQRPRPTPLLAGRPACSRGSRSRRAPRSTRTATRAAGTAGMGRSAGRPGSPPSTTSTSRWRLHGRHG